MGNDTSSAVKRADNELQQCLFCGKEIPGGACFFRIPRQNKPIVLCSPECALRAFNRNDVTDVIQAEVRRVIGVLGLIVSLSVCLTFTGCRTEPSSQSEDYHYINYHDVISVKTVYEPPWDLAEFESMQWHKSH